MANGKGNKSGAQILQEMRKPKGPVKPDRVPQEDWDQLSDEHKAAVAAMSVEELEDAYPTESETDQTVERARDISVTGSVAFNTHRVTLAARKFGEAMATDLVSTLEQGAVMAADAAFTPYKALAILIRDRAKLDLDNSPVPGRTAEWIKLKYGDSENAPLPDKYKVVQGERTVSYSFWEVALATTQEGKAMLASIDKWEKQAETDKDVPNKKAYARAMARRFRKLYTTALGYLRNAGAVWHQKLAVEAMPLVETVFFIPERDAEGKEIPDSIMKTPEPIEIWDKGQRNRDDHVYCSISTFLRYNVQWALDGKLISDEEEKNGAILLNAEKETFSPLGGVAALRATVRRVADTGTAQVPTIETDTIVEDFMSELNAWFVNSEGDVDTKRVGKLKAALLNPNNRSYLVEYYNLMLALDSIWVDVQTEHTRYNKRVGEQLEEMVGKGKAA